MRTFLVMIALAQGAPAPAGGWTKLPSLPDKEGVAGPFAGVSHGALIVAGGANFPDEKPWEGGKKVWSDTVFVLGPDVAAFWLPNPGAMLKLIEERRSAPGSA